MNADWLSRYPRAAALLQRDDDVLDYAPQHSGGLERPGRAPDHAAEALTLLEPYNRLGFTIRHTIVRPFATWISAVVRDPIAAPSLETCDTLLDERMWHPDGQPCPCGALRWYQEPPRSHEPDADDIDRGDW